MLNSYPHSQTKQVYHRAPYRPLPPQSHVARGSKNAGPVGAQQALYFKRPLVANRELESVPVQHMDPQINQQQQQPQQQPSTETKSQRTMSQKSQRMRSTARETVEDMPFKEVGTQSNVRDSEAQTDPFTPDVFVPDGENPEVLSLAELKFPEGFKMTEDTLKEIDRIKRRRDVESNLPMGTDSKAFENRVKMLKDLEMQEWEEREEKIRKEQEERLESIRLRLEVREKHREQRNRDRIEKKRQREMETLAKDLDKVETLRGKTMRKTQKKHTNPENKLRRRDIIEEQTIRQPPRKRDGRIAHDKTIAYEIQPALLTDPLGVQEVEMHQAQKHTRIKPLPKKRDKLTSTKKHGQRKKQKVIDNIEFARKMQLVEKMKQDEEKTNLLDMYRATPRVSRPKTPVLEFDDEEDDLENAVITIQKLMRGREKQNDFFIGKERTYELIKELQEVEKVVRREQDLKGKYPELVKEAEDKEEEKLVQNVMENTQAEVVSKALDYLSKELTRQREMERIQVIKTMAEMERRKREARELGLRQKEEEARAQREQEYTDVARTTHDAIDTYLDQIFDETAERLAHREALEEVYEQTKQEAEYRESERQKESTSGEQGETPNADEQEIKDLVTSFLIPQVKRSSVQNQVEQEQKKYLKAVHETFQDVMPKVTKE